MRAARSYLFDGPGLGSALAMSNVERALLSEAEAARKAGRRGDQVHALLELGRLQVERNALSDAGKNARQVGELLLGAGERPEAQGPGGDKAEEKAAAPLSDEERGRWGAELLTLRALMLVAIGERDLAEARAQELEAQLKGPAGQQRVQELRGDLAARSGDAKGAAQLLDKASRPTMRLALALALAAGKAGEQADPARARSLMEELSKRTVNDLEGALSRSRARAWLKANPAEGKDKEKSKDGGDRGKEPADRPGEGKEPPAREL